MPFHLKALGYSGISVLAGYLLFAYWSSIMCEVYYPGWAQVAYLLSSSYPHHRVILLMESGEYWVMAIARTLQGISAAAVWTAGLALVCDTVPEEKVGRYTGYLGLAMSGLPLGQLIGPPVGGALYDRFGIRGPCLFAITIVSVDLVGRSLVIERREALAWGFDPAASINTSSRHPSVSPLDPPYGTFAAVKYFPIESESQGSDISLPEESSSSLDQGPGAYEALIFQTQPVPISLFQVIKGLCMSSRAVAAVVNSLVSGFLYSFQEPTLPVHLQRTWQLNPSQIGLIFLAAAPPAMLAPSIAGWFADHIGVEWVSFLCLLLAIPCWIAVTIRGNLSLFVAAFAFENLWTSAFVAPVTTELALVSRLIPGVGYAHVYGAFNVAVGIGASVGPVLSGEIFQRSSQGWTILNLIAVAIIIAASVVVAFFTGERPLARRLRYPS
ncbi:MFS general substrate transporter [Russula earlei]|uniref:MFS general substrate transporter n=1 Tax=Russula earlei TaxID=71964 RepID=A0ACC0UPI6_9AGAM|nr:MFS general substrate transporter [Russula earlei]